MKWARGYTKPLRGRHLLHAAGNSMSRNRRFARLLPDIWDRERGLQGGEGRCPPPALEWGGGSPVPGAEVLGIRASAVSCGGEGAEPSRGRPSLRGGSPAPGGRGESAGEGLCEIAAGCCPVGRGRCAAAVPRCWENGPGAAGDLFAIIFSEDFVCCAQIVTFAGIIPKIP